VPQWNELITLLYRGYGLKSQNGQKPDHGWDTWPEEIISIRNLDLLN